MAMGVGLAHRLSGLVPVDAVSKPKACHVISSWPTLFLQVIAGLSSTWLITPHCHLGGSFRQMQLARESIKRDI